MRFYFTCTSKATIKKSYNYKCGQGCGEIGTLTDCWWKCKMVQPLCKTFWQLLNKLNIELPYDPVRPLLSIYPGEMKTYTQMFIVALFTIEQRRGQTKRPSTDPN